MLRVWWVTRILIVLMVLADCGLIFGRLVFFFWFGCFVAICGVLFWVVAWVCDLVFGSCLGS